MKSFVAEHGRAIAVITVVSYLVTVLAGGSIIAAYVTTFVGMAIWLWRVARTEKFS
ncbi:MAG TPA: hypothetical protein VFJ61_12870 [Solirubrobacterales bacterium]|nr:hypothetical protein [Solirubrobacterales bacterium]